MPLDTIDQPVTPGDLILAYTRKRKRMFLVTSASSKQGSPDTSTILVKRAPYSVVDEPGFGLSPAPTSTTSRRKRISKIQTKQVTMATQLMERTMRAIAKLSRCGHFLTSSRDPLTLPSS